MALIQWQDTYSVGVPALDADHRILINLLNQLYEAREEGQTRDVVGSVLNVLVEYTIGHFHREEMLMEHTGYPGLEAHRKIHVALASEVEALQQQYLRGRHAAVDELFEFLKDWLIKHILGVDARYAPWVKTLEPSPGDLRAPFIHPADGDDEKGTCAGYT